MEYRKGKEKIKRKGIIWINMEYREGKEKTKRKEDYMENRET